MTWSAAPGINAVRYGWQETEGGRKYLLENDEYAKGIIVIDDTACVFSEDGFFTDTYTGFGKKNEKTVYYEDGKLFTGGWLNCGGNTYYFYPHGTMATGMVIIDGTQYYFSNEGVLKNGYRDFSVTADKTSINTGKREFITFTVSADNISGRAMLGEISEMQRLKDGKWYHVKPDEGFCVPAIAYLLGNTEGIEIYSASKALSFCPEAYKLTLETGRYRVEIPIYTDVGTIKKYCEFEITEPVSVKTEKKEYDLRETEEIIFTTTVNKPAMVYSPCVYDLYFFDKEKNDWQKVTSADGTKISPAAEAAKAGDVINSRLDLTRYSHSSLKTGTYRAVCGEGLSCEFRLRAPYEAYAVQNDLESPRKKQITVTVVNETDADVSLKGYGGLYRLEKGKWKKLSPKKSLDTEMLVPAMHKWEKSLMLSDYYKAGDLTKGDYCIRLEDQSGYVSYAYFSLK